MVKFIYSILFVFLILGCKEKAENELAEEATTSPVELPVDFLSFYEEFHQDSLYQLNHIAFPLSGKPASGQFNFELKDFKWTRDGWKIHKRMADDDDTFDRKFQVITENMVVEYIFSPAYGYHMERRYGKLSDGWNLIYYADMQEGGSSE